MASQQPTKSSDDEASARYAERGEGRAEDAAADGPEGAGEEALGGEPEPWEPWETKLVAWSLVIGAVGLLVLGVLVDRFILS